MNYNLGKIECKRKSGEELFENNGKHIGISINDFWSRGFSNLTTNNLRGILAEYLISDLFDCANFPRQERDEYDVLTKEGLKIEVKSSSYIQSRDQKNLSNISFSIRPTRGRDENGRKKTSTRQSDIYIFCLLAHKDQNTLNPMELSQREFYIIKTNDLNSLVGNQKTTSLSKLLKLGLKPVSYYQITKTIEELTK